MAERDDTKLLGLRGLYVEAQRAQRRRGRARLCRGGGEGRAVARLGRAGGAGIPLRRRRLGRRARGARPQQPNGLIDKAGYRRQRAVLLTARALGVEDTDRDRARALALEAVKLAPTLVPAAELAARLLGEAGELRRRAAIIEAAWKANPHPDLADTYAHLRSGESARDRLARVQSLAQKAPGHVEARSRWRAPRSTRRNSPRRARRCKPLLEGADPARRDADGRDRAARKRRRGPRARMDGARAARRRAIRPGPPTASCPTAGCRCRR